MTNWDEQLEKLCRETERKSQLEDRRKELRLRKDRLSGQAWDLEQRKAQESADVERLENGGIASFFLNLTGKLEEKIQQERQEAYDAAIEYAAAQRELDEVTAELRRCEEELRQLQGCERRYEQLLREKAETIRTAGGAAAEGLLRLEQNLAALEQKKTELREAVSAGSHAWDLAQRVLGSLHSAANWGTWDLMGGGMMSDIAKHSHLDTARREIEMLRSQLRSFQTELADVTVRGEISIEVDDFLRFADYFFDGFFADWAVMDKINESKRQVEGTVDEIADALDRLHELMNKTEQERAEVRSALEQYIRETACP